MGFTSGIFHSGNTCIKPGQSISGMSYFFLSVYGDNKFDPEIIDSKILGNFVIYDNFDKKSKNDVVFNYKSLEEIKNIIPQIEKILS